MNFFAAAGLRCCWRRRKKSCWNSTLRYARRTHVIDRTPVLSTIVMYTIITVSAFLIADGCCRARRWLSYLFHFTGSAVLAAPHGTQQINTKIDYLAANFFLFWLFSIIFFFFNHFFIFPNRRSTPLNYFSWLLLLFFPRQVTLSPSRLYIIYVLTTLL